MQKISTGPVRACCAAKLPTVAAPLKADLENSLYESGAGWTTDSGEPFQFAQLSGRATVLSLFFASCSMKCPITVDNMLAVEASLPRAARSNACFVLVTMDPAADTVAVLRAYRQTHQLDHAHWLLLRGKETDVQRLADQLAFRFQKNGLGSFTHDSLITLLDPAGRIAAQSHGLYAGAEELRAQLAVLVR